MKKIIKTIIPIVIIGAMIFFGVYFGIIRHFAEIKIAREFNQAAMIKERYRLDKLQLVLAGRDKNGLEVRLGERDAGRFVPNLEISKWAGEVKLKVKPTLINTLESGFLPSDFLRTPVKNLQAIVRSLIKSVLAAPTDAYRAAAGRGPVDGKLSFDQEKINFTTADEDYRFYEIAANQDHPEGAYEFEVIFKKKPLSNVVSLDIEVQNLDFFYQPPLNQEKHRPSIVKCTQTRCFDKDNNVVIERPENVVGSYAVYYKDRKSGDFSPMGGKNYMAGKAFHIYRPKIIDYSNNWTWGELGIDESAGKMNISIPPDFLERAAYPVIVDPTFGKTSVGQTAGGFDNANEMEGAWFTAPADAFTLDSITLYKSTTTISGNIKGILARKNNLNIITNGIGSPAAWGTSSEYITSTFSTPPSLIPGVDYVLMFIPDVGSNPDRIIWPYDSVPTSGNYFDGSNNYTSPTNPTDAGYTDGLYVMTIYATYTAGTYSCGTYFCDGLVGYWSFNGQDTNWTTETTGTTNDLSGKVNNGTMTNMSRSSSPVAGISGQAFKFDGVNDFVNVFSHSSLDNIEEQGGGGMTVSGWIYRTVQATPGYPQYIAIKQTSGAFGFGVNSSGRLSFRKQYTIQDLSVASDIDSYSLNSWQHILVTWNGGPNYTDVKFYVNGNLKGYYVGGQDGGGDKVSDANKNLYIGINAYGADPFNGLIDEVRIYNRVLSGSEIQELYKVEAAKIKINSPPSAPANSTSGLVGYWSFNGPDMNWGSTTAEALDRSGQNNNGNATNMANTAVTEGISGQALEFDGVNDLIEISPPSSFNLAPDGDVTYIAWVKLRENPWLYTFQNIIGDYEGPCFQLMQDKLLFSNGNGVWSNALSWELNRWYHLAVVVIHSSEGNAYWYRDGQNLGSTSTLSHGTTVTPNHFDIGGNEGGEWLHGKIDEVRVYNRALSAGEIQELYKVGTAKMKINSPAAVSASSSSGLVGYWSFNGQDMNWRYNRVYDRSGSGNNGEMKNMSTTSSPIEGISGQALKFDGSSAEGGGDDYIDLDSSGNIILSGTTTAWAICAWVFEKSFPVISHQHMIYTRQTNGSNGGFEFISGDSYGGNTTYGIHTYNGSWTNHNGNTQVPLNVWTHLCATRNGTNLYLYMNGQTDGSQAYTAPNSIQGLQQDIGGFPSGGAGDDLVFDGYIDEVRIYNRALSPSEIQELYNQGTRKAKFKAN